VARLAAWHSLDPSRLEPAAAYARKTACASSRDHEKWRMDGSDISRAVAGKLHIMELNPDGNVHQKITLPGVFNPITYVHDFMVTKSWCGCALCRLL
jgi:hypothetical protein